MKKIKCTIQHTRDNKNRPHTDELFEGINIQGRDRAEIENCKTLYQYLLDSADKAEFMNESIDDTIDEGLLTGLIGGAAGALLGPTVMRAVCRILGVNEQGTLGKLLTSPLVAGSVGAELGY